MTPTPENRRILTLSDNLPETKQALAESVTRGIDALYHVGEIKGRQDVIQALTEAGLEVVRVTRSSISIADPNGGKNIRLKGAFYEQSFTDGRGVREKAERESRIYRDNAERRVQQAEKSVSKAVTSNETKIKDAIALFTTSTEESLEKHGKG